MDKLLSELNERQREAVTAPLGPTLVLAGAGSGKTRVLTYRIAWLLREKLFRSENILALTFTNKAAGEMKGRIRQLLTRPAATLSSERRGAGGEEGITMGTFHSVCARILRQDIEKLGLGYNRNFVIFDEDDRLKLLKQIVLELGLGEEFRPQTFGYYISAAKNRLVSPSELDLDNNYFQETLSEVYEFYQKRLAEFNALDFDDLLRLVCELFSDSNDSNLHSNNSNEFVNSNRSVLKKYQDRFKYILVDEYQDTNHAQYIILKNLAAEHQNLFVVGDDAQSIYGFRGANMQNILDFKKDYLKAKVYMLEQNYRSTQGILEVAHEVIRLNPFQYEKKLWTDNAGGSKVNLYEARDEVDEAEFVLKRILNFKNSPPHEGELEGVIENMAAMTSPTPPHEEGIAYTPILDQFTNKVRKFHIPYSTFDIPDNLNEIVILYRTHAQSRAFEEALISSGVPYQIIGGIKFYERKEIKDTLSYLRVIQNPRDLVSMSRIINLPARGIGPATLQEINKALKKYKFNYKRLLANLDQLGLSPRALAGAREFFEMLDSPPHEERDLPFNSPPREEGLGEVIENTAGRKSKPTMTPLTSPLMRGERGGSSSSRGGEPSILDIMHFLLTRSGYKESLLKEGEEGLTRWENIEELFNVAAKYKRLPWPEALLKFLEEVALMTDLDKMEESGNKLTLMTLHSAKGLEFNDVFFVGLEEGLLPHSRSLLNPEELAEEIRLAYVGITRAKENLYLSYSRQRQHYGEIKRCVPSRVIKAIPKKLINKIPNPNAQSPIKS